jgi:exopolysaccharide biosynthesis polyprenyl glycosylphosphotransferase
MSSTSFSNTASLGPVVPFAGQSTGQTRTRDEVARHFETAAGLFERIMDVCAVAAGLYLAYEIQRLLLGVNGFDIPKDTGLAASVGFAFLMVLLLEKNGAYSACGSLLAVRETERLLRTTLMAISLGLPFLVLVTRMIPFAFCGCALATVSLGLAVEKWHVQKLERTACRQMRATRRAVIVGTGALSRRIFSALVQTPRVGIDPVAFVEPHAPVPEAVIHEAGYRRKRKARVLPGPVTIEMLRELDARVLILSDPMMSGDQKLTVKTAAGTAGITTYMTSHSEASLESGIEYLELDGMMLSFDKKPAEHHLYEAAKRTLDVLLAAVSLIIAIPLLAAAAIAVRFTSSGPMIFRQQRTGRNGRIFEMYKFRTMYADSERYARSPVSGSDPRITRVGRILRHTCIDELPQLLNVLKGEMSLVGPRPEMPFIVEKYEAVHQRRLSVKPGITGLWQLSADRLAPIHENISYDLYYLRHNPRFLWELSKQSMR